MQDRYIIEYGNHTRKDFEEVWNIEREYLESSTISSVQQVMEWDKKIMISIFLLEIPNLIKLSVK